MSARTDSGNKIVLAGLACVALIGLFGCASPARPWGELTRSENRTYLVDNRKDRELIFRDSQATHPAPTLVMVHGLGASKAAWRYVAPELQSSHRTITLDLLGHGDSSGPATFDYAMSSQARALTEFIRAHAPAPQRIVLVGSSYGGGVVLETARLLQAHANAPRVAGLILMAPTAIDFPPPPSVELANSPLTRWWLINFGNPRTVAELMLRGAFAEDKLVRSEMIDEYARCFDSQQSRANIANAALEIFTELKARKDAESRYAQLACPILLLWGDGDQVVPLSVSRALLSKLPTARLRVIPGCGHTPAEECPDATLTEFRAFLASLPADESP